MQFFDIDKAIHTILYIANRLEKPNFHSIAKILYFSDKMHLQNYGRFILNDDYVAMKHGPVPSTVYDMLKTVSPQRHRGYGVPDYHQLEDFISIEDYQVRPKQAADLDEFSISELSCLDRAIACYGDKSFEDLTEISHDSAWENTVLNEPMSMESIAQTLPNSSEILAYLHNPLP